jgi:predicted NBD/HSP70 family sugar kinase
LPRASGIGQEAPRNANLSALLTLVHLQGPTTRAALTTALSLNRSTIGDLTRRLEELGLVIEVPPGEEPVAVSGRRTGRPSLVVAPNEDVTVLAVALDVDRITVAVVGLGGVVLDRRTRLHQRGEHDGERVVETVGQMCDELLSLELGDRPLGVGVSVPGAVRESDGLVRFAPNLGWTDEPFTDLLAAALKLPVMTANDADLGARAEHLRGAAVGANDVAYLSGSVGIGGGFYVGGEPLRGAIGFAGEVGHVMVDSSGEQCRCGAIGCLETKVGENQLLADAGRLPGGGPPAVAEVIAAAAGGDARARDAVDHAAHWLGVGLRPVFALFNPQVVVLGGLLSQVWSARHEIVLHGLDPDSLISARDVLDIRPSALGDDASLIGAAELAFTPLLVQPTRTARRRPRAAAADGS